MNGQVRFGEAYHTGKTTTLKAVKDLANLNQAEILQSLRDELLKGMLFQQALCLLRFGTDEDMRSGYQATLPYSQYACEPRSLF